MYRYVHTRSRVHRVIVEGGKAFKVEQCNLDDAAFSHLDDVEPEGTHCAYCWTGWVEPTPEEKAAAAAAAKPDPVADDRKPVALVQSTRRLAVASLAAAALLGGAAGYLVSPDPSSAAADTVGLQNRLEDIMVELRVLANEVANPDPTQAGPPAPVVVVVPTAPPTEKPDPTAPPTPGPTQAGGRLRVDGHVSIGNGRVTIIIATPRPQSDSHKANPTPVPTKGPKGSNPPPDPTPEPTPEPTPTWTEEPTATP